MVEVHNQHEDDYEPEETYIIPNCPPASREVSNNSATATRTNQQGIIKPVTYTGDRGKYNFWVKTFLSSIEQGLFSNGTYPVLTEISRSTLPKVFSIEMII